MPEDILALLPDSGMLVTSRPFQEVELIVISFQMGFMPTKTFRDGMTGREGLFFVLLLKMSAIRTQLL